MNIAREDIIVGIEFQYLVSKLRDVEVGLDKRVKVASVANVFESDRVE